PCYCLPLERFAFCPANGAIAASQRSLRKLPGKGSRPSAECRYGWPLQVPSVLQLSALAPSHRPPRRLTRKHRSAFFLALERTLILAGPVNVVVSLNVPLWSF